MNVLNYLGELLAQIWSFISNTVNATVAAFSVILEVITMPLWISGFVPTFVGSCIIIVVAIGVVKLILGWSGE